MNSRDLDKDPEWIAVQERETIRENIRFEMLLLCDIYNVDIGYLMREAECIFRGTAIRRVTCEEDVCIDCHMQVRGGEYGDVHEYYNVHDDVWAQSGLGPDDGMLCIGGLEKRIGRELKADDCGNCLINTHPLYTRSERFIDRLSRA